MTTITDRPAVTETEQKRARLIADARALLDLLEANPELPFDRLEILEHAIGTDETEREQVNAAAEVLGVTPELGHAEHYSATKTFGRASYRLVAIPDRSMKRFHAVQALGEAAFEQQEAEATS